MYKKIFLFILLIQKTDTFALRCLMVTNKSPFYTLIAIRIPKIGLNEENLYYKVPRFPEAAFIPFDEKKFTLQILDSEYLDFIFDESQTRGFDFHNKKCFMFSNHALDLENKLIIASSDYDGSEKDTEVVDFDDRLQKEAAEFLANHGKLQ